MHTQTDPCLSQPALNESSSRIALLISGKSPYILHILLLQHLKSWCTFKSYHKGKEQTSQRYSPLVPFQGQYKTPGTRRWHGRSLGGEDRLGEWQVETWLWGLGFKSPRRRSRWLPKRGRPGGLTSFSTEPDLSSSCTHVGARTRRVTQLICAQLLHGRSMNPTSLPNQWVLCRCEKQGSLQTLQKKKKMCKIFLRDREIKENHSNKSVHLPKPPTHHQFHLLTHFKNKLAPTRSGRWASPESSLNSLLSYSCVPAASEQVGYK